MYCFSVSAFWSTMSTVREYVSFSGIVYVAFFVSPAKQKRDICTAFPAAASGAATAA